MSARLFIKTMSKRLFDFTLFIFDMLAHNRIILPDHHFFGHGARVFLGHVKVASVRGRVQADFNCGRLRHFSSPASAKGQAGEILSWSLPFSDADATVNHDEAEFEALTQKPPKKMRGEPISRILSRGYPLGWPFLWTQDCPCASSCQPEPLGQSSPAVISAHRSTRTRFLFGIAPGGACHAGAVTSPPVGSYPTLSPLPVRARAVCFLWRSPSGCPARALPGTVALWSPDFPRTLTARGHPALRAP